MLGFITSLMPTPEKQAALVRLDELRAALQQEAPSDVITHALHQCERLKQAMELWHAEGLRFAAFTLFRLMQQPTAPKKPAIQTAVAQLRSAIEAAGYPH